MATLLQRLKTRIDGLPCAPEGGVAGRGAQFWVVSLLAPVFLFVALAAWGFSSPLGSSPDDDYHLASIWCGLGDRAELCESASEPDERMVPTVFTSARCYSYNAEQSAECFDGADSSLTATDRVDADRDYPPVFYGTMSLFATTDTAFSVAAMRVFNAALATCFFTTLFWLLPRAMRPALVVSLAATAVPLSSFLVASTNPSSWAVISAGGVWIATWGAFRSHGLRRNLLCVMLIVATMLGGGARADSAVYAVFGVLVGALLGWRRRSILPVISAVIACVISVMFYLTAGQASAATSGLENASDPLTRRQSVENALQLPSLWSGALGGWGLGWLDTPMPAVVTVGSLSVAAAACFIGIRTLSWRRGIALAATFAALLVIPFYLLQQSNAVVGTQVQPRYILPLMVIGIGVATATHHAAADWRGPRQWAAAGVLVVANATALHVEIRRYTTGLDQFSADPGASAEWWWSAFPTPVATWVIGSIALAGALVCILSANSRRVRTTGDDMPEKDYADQPPR